MPEEAIHVRLNRLEEDRRNTDEQLKQVITNQVSLVVSITRSEGVQDKILALAIDQKCTLDDTARRSLRTEQLTTDLFRMQGAQLEDLRQIKLSQTNELKELREKQAAKNAELEKDIKFVMDRPNKTNEKIIWLMVTLIIMTVLGNLLGFILKSNIGG